MGYVVRTGVANSGYPVVDRIPKATNVVVEDGHLLVKLDMKSIAVYAPGEWRRAYRDSDVTSGAHYKQDEPYSSDEPKE